MSSAMMNMSFIKKCHQDINIQQITHPISSLIWFTFSNVTGNALAGRLTTLSPLRTICPRSGNWMPFLSS